MYYYFPSSSKRLLPFYFYSLFSLKFWVYDEMIIFIRINLL